MSLVLNVEILGEFKNLTAATKGAQSQLAGLNSKVSSFSRMAKTAFASIGVGLSFAFIARELNDAAKAAVEDQKSQALLAKQLETTTRASKDQIAAVERSIAKWQTQASVLDDELRPAYSSLIRSTGDITDANRLMDIALNASAASGKSLESVSLALGKAYNGSETALIKLMPQLKGSKDAIGELDRATAGAAATASNSDPYKRLSVAMADLQESIGVILLPVLEKMSSWLVSIAPEAQAFFKSLMDPTTPMGKAWAQLGTSFVNFGKTLNSVFAGGKADANGFITVLKILASTLDAVATSIKIISGQYASEFGQSMGTAVRELFTGSTPKATTAPLGTRQNPATSLQQMPKVNTSSPKNVTNNVTVKVDTVQDAKSTIQILTDWQRSTGSTLAQALR